MLWLALDLPQLSLEALEMRRGIDQSSLVVLAQRGPRRWIVGSRHSEITAGIDWGSAQSIMPTLRPHMRDLQAERETLDSLSTWAWRFGSEVVREIVESPLDYGQPQHRIAIGITPSLRLFGGLDNLLVQFDAAFATTGHAGQRAVAPTLDAAILLARAGAAKPVADAAQLRSALRPLPLLLLDLPPATLRKLRAIGLRNLGELLALPMDGLARRYGPGLVESLERLLGSRADGRPRHRLAASYSRRFDLGSEVETVEALDLPLRRMTQDFATYLLVRDSGVQEFRLTLEHSRRRISVFELRLAAASRTALRLHRMIRERLDREVLPEAVRALRLSATRFLAPASGQHDLFDCQADEDWLTLLETLTAKLGDDAVHALATADDCRPERAWRRIAPEVAIASKTPPRAGQASGGATSPTTLPPVRTAIASRPLWLVEPPRQLATRPPQLFAAERIEGGWWDGGDVSRDYYRARLGHSRAWVFQDRRTHAWFLHGLWA
jgi:protein ImuB